MGVLDAIASLFDVDKTASELTTSYRLLTNGSNLPSPPALERLVSRDEINAATAVLWNGSTSARREAVKLLAALAYNDKRAIAPLVDALVDADGDVRETAAAALGKTGVVTAEVNPCLRNLAAWRLYYIASLERDPGTRAVMKASSEALNARGLTTRGQLSGFSCQVSGDPPAVVGDLVMVGTKVGGTSTDQKLLLAGAIGAVGIVALGVYRRRRAS